MTVTYHAKDLSEIADKFNDMAQGCAAKANTSKKRWEINQLSAQAATWRAAAEFLRTCKIGE